MVDGLSGWGGARGAEVVTVDVNGCGDGVGEWLGVIGLGKVWVSGGLSG